MGIDINEYAIKLAKEASIHVFGKNSIIRNICNALAQNGIYVNRQIRRYHEDRLVFRVQSVYDLQESECFDYVLCHDVIEHVEHPEKLLKIVHDCMRKYAVISTPNGTYKMPKEYDVQLWTPEQFKELLSGFQYKVIRIDTSKMYIKLLK